MSRWQNEPETVPAAEVQVGDFLPGIDNGYVIATEESPNIGMGDYMVNVTDGMTMITFNDAQGGENYLIVNPDVPISIRRGEMI